MQEKQHNIYFNWQTCIKEDEKNQIYGVFWNVKYPLFAKNLSGQKLVRFIIISLISQLYELNCIYHDNQN